MSLEETLKDIPQIESDSGDEGAEPTKFVRVSILTHGRLSKLGRIFTNVYGRHYTHNDTISEMLSLWEAETGQKL